MTMAAINEQVDKIMKNVTAYQAKSDSELKQEFAAIKSQLQQQRLRKAAFRECREKLFALIGVQFIRQYQMTPFKVQYAGAIVLSDNNIAEMKTGEGKTLVAAFPLILNAIRYEHVQLITVNEYLAQRDQEWLKPIYDFFDLTSAVNLNQMNLNQKHQVYAANIMYTTASELGFDYLRNNMIKSPEEQVITAPFNYALVDEVDSILIDEAKTPLIIAQAGHGGADRYVNADKFVKSLNKTDYKINREAKTAFLTASGDDKAKKFLHQSAYDLNEIDAMHLISEALQANYIQTEDVDYMLRTNKQSGNKEIVLIDQFTGRVLEGREYSDGLQQAIQAKHRRDGVELTGENVTAATITLQNFFRLFKHLAGMSGTAKTEEKEFIDVYNMKVQTIPTNKPMIRKDLEPEVFIDQQHKWDAILKRIQKVHQTGEPILVGTRSVEDSEHLSRLLDQHHIDHVVLNAKQDAAEANIVAQAGQLGAITIATNMAGRGTDIKLTDETRKLGGLYVISANFNESRRVDLQLIGRSGRQGDPGTSIIIAALDDDLFKRFGNQKRLQKFTKAQGNVQIPMSRLTKALINDAQLRVENQNYDQRDSILKYDDIVREQREIYYGDRHDVVFGTDQSKLANHLINQMKLIGQPTPKFDELTMPEIQAVILRAFDEQWIQHIDALDRLKKAIGYRSYQGTNPVIAYQNEAQELFNQLKVKIAHREAELLADAVRTHRANLVDVFDNQFKVTNSTRKTIF